MFFSKNPIILSRSQLNPPRRVRQGLSVLHSERRLYRISMTRATLFSSFLHVFGPLALIALLLFVLKIPIWDWFTPKNKPHDLTFVLVNDRNVTPPEKPLFKGNANQRAGGKRIPTQQPRPADHQSGGSGKTVVHKQPPPKLAKVASQASIKSTVTTAAPVAVKANPVTPTIATANKPEAIAAIAQPDAELSGGSTTGKPDDSGVASAGTGLGNATGAGIGEGSVGSAQGGDGAAGVDVAEDVDYGPFMAELKRRIYRHWIPPRSKVKKKVLLLFYLARDGKLVKIETKKTSGDEEADLAAIAAVQASVPIPFPPQVKEDVLPIEFTFDYNIFNPKNTKRGLKW